MPAVIHYICQRELLPMVERTLEANGYSVDLPQQQGCNDTTVFVMNRGLTSVLLTDSPRQKRAVIDIWGLDKVTVAQLLERLPVDTSSLKRTDRVSGN